MEQSGGVREVACTVPRSGAGMPVPEEVVSRNATVKCMGRTFGCVRAGAAVSISDVTDITRPVALGTAEPDGDGTWRLRTVRGVRLAPTVGLLHAVAALREANWPPC